MTLFWEPFTCVVLLDGPLEMTSIILVSGPLLSDGLSPSVICYYDKRHGMVFIKSKVFVVVPWWHPFFLQNEIG